LWKEVGALAGVEARLARDACGEELLAAWVELAMQSDGELEGAGCEDAVVTIGGGGVDCGVG
jgi:hypothetical protein